MRAVVIWFLICLSLCDEDPQVENIIGEPYVAFHENAIAPATKFDLSCFVEKVECWFGKTERVSGLFDGHYHSVLIQKFENITRVVQRYAKVHKLNDQAANSLKMLLEQRNSVNVPPIEPMLTVLRPADGSTVGMRAVLFEVAVTPVLTNPQVCLQWKSQNYDCDSELSRVGNTRLYYCPEAGGNNVNVLLFEDGIFTGFSESVFLTAVARGIELHDYTPSKSLHLSRAAVVYLSTGYFAVDNTTKIQVDVNQVSTGEQPTVGNLWSIYIFNYTAPLTDSAFLVIPNVEPKCEGVVTHPLMVEIREIGVGSFTVKADVEEAAEFGPTELQSAQFAFSAPSIPLIPRVEWSEDNKGAYPEESAVTVISLYLRHDANICIARGGEILVAMELERFFDKRYFDMNLVSSFTSLVEASREFRRAVNAARRVAGVFETFDYAVHIFESTFSTQWADILPTVIDARQWVVLDHHRAHALLGFYDSGFESAIVLSFDGGGNDGSEVIYKSTRENPLASVLHDAFTVTYTNAPNMGYVYTEVGRVLITEFMNSSSLSIAGKIMAYEALGSPREHFKTRVREYFQWGFLTNYPVNYFKDLRGNRRQVEQDMASSLQAAFEERVLELLTPVMEQHSDVDGIVLTGGCALNVKVNDVVRHRFGKPVWIPSAPNDCGLAAGAVWAIAPPILGHAPMTYAGMPLWDLADLPAWVKKRGGVRVGTEYLASLLVNEKSVIGVVRGRQEFGPRALGRRSLLAFPDSNTVKERMNRIKVRAWYRPVSPIILEEDQSIYFNDSVISPYMSFAPRMRPEMLFAFSSVAHLDGSARVQTVNPTQEKWVYDLVRAVKNLSNYGILANTSFNTRGSPLVNDIGSALHMLDELDDLDYVLIEDYLFDKDSMQCHSKGSQMRCEL